MPTNYLRTLWTAGADSAHRVTRFGSIARPCSLTLLIVGIAGLLLQGVTRAATVEENLRRIGRPTDDPLERVLRTRVYEELAQQGDVRAFRPLVLCRANAIRMMERKDQPQPTLLNPDPASPFFIGYGDSERLSYVIKDLIKNLRKETATPTLVGLLKDPEMQVRWWAAVALGSLQDSRAVQPLLRLLEDSESAVRDHAAAAIGRIGDRSAVQPLIDWLSDSSHTDPRSSVVAALGNLRDPRALSVVRWSLDHEDAEVRSAAAAALGKFGDPKVRDQLVDCLADPDDSVRKGAMESLAELGETKALVGCLLDPSPSVRYRARDWLEKKGYQPIMPAEKAAILILDGQFSDPEWEQIRSLGPEAFGPLVRALTFSSRAATTLGQMGDPRAVAPLVACLTNRLLSTRAKAAEALGHFDDSRATEALRQAASDESRAVRDAASAALEQSRQRANAAPAKSASSLDASAATATPATASISVEPGPPSRAGDPLNHSNSGEPIRFSAPHGTRNVARGAIVKSSTPPFDGEFAAITDGNKGWTESDMVVCRKGLQWVQVDLGRTYTVEAIVLWHDYRLSGHTQMHAVIVQVSDDPEFRSGVRTLFNNDRSGSSGLGVGSDDEYPETRYGFLVEARRTSARYVRCYARGCQDMALSRYTEIEVYAAP